MELCTSFVTSFLGSTIFSTHHLPLNLRTPSLTWKSLIFPSLTLFLIFISSGSSPYCFLITFTRGEATWSAAKYPLSPGKAISIWSVSKSFKSFFSWLSRHANDPLITYIGHKQLHSPSLDDTWFPCYSPSNVLNTFFFSCSTLFGWKST